MHESEEDGVFAVRFAGRIRAVAEDQAKGISRLMPSAASFHFVWLFRICELLQANLLKRVSQIRCSKPITQELCEGAASRPTAWVWEIVVDVGFTAGGKEEEPVLLDG